MSSTYLYNSFQHCRIAKCNMCMMSRHVLGQNLTPEEKAKAIDNREEHLRRMQ